MWLRRKKLVLVVDDEEDFGFFVKANLEARGNYRVRVATSGEQGLELAARRTPAAILLHRIDYTGRIGVKPAFRTLCDALESPAPGEITFPIVQKNVSDIAAVDDAEVAEAVRYAAATLKLVVEPGGAAGLAALLAGKFANLPDGPAGLVLSGGNIDPDLLARILRREI